MWPEGEIHPFSAWGGGRGGGGVVATVSFHGHIISSTSPQPAKIS